MSDRHQSDEVSGGGERPPSDDGSGGNGGRPRLQPPASRWTIALVAILGAVIAFLALRHSPRVQYIWWMPQRLGIWADHNGVMRNGVAFFAFALLVFLGVGDRWRHALTVAAFATALEVAQLGIRGRVFDWRDIGVSLAGIAVAWPLAWIVRRARR